MPEGPEERGLDAVEGEGIVMVWFYFELIDKAIMIFGLSFKDVLDIQRR